MNRLDLPVPKEISHMTREEYNELVFWLYQCSQRQIELMADLFHPMPEDEARAKRQEIYDLTRLVTQRTKEAFNGDLKQTIFAMMDILHYKAIVPGKLTAEQARILERTGAAQELLRGLTL